MPGLLLRVIAALFALQAASVVPAVDAGQDEGFQAWWLRVNTPSDPPLELRETYTANQSLPSFTLSPSATGEQVARVALPFPSGSLLEGQFPILHSEVGAVTPEMRILTFHPGSPKCIRRAMLIFPWQFKDKSPVRFTLSAAHESSECKSRFGIQSHEAKRVEVFEVGGFQIEMSSREIRLKSDGKELAHATLLAPTIEPQEKELTQVIESGRHSLWARRLVPDSQFPRIIEVRADSLGNLVARAHLQRFAESDGYSPEFGWDIRQGRMEDPGAAERGWSVGSALALMKFEGEPHTPQRFGEGFLSFPEAHLLMKGYAQFEEWPAGGQIFRYLRALPDEKVPHQPSAWRSAGFAYSQKKHQGLNPLYEPNLKINIAPDLYDALYGSGSLPSMTETADIIQSHHAMIIESMLKGDDAGNVTLYRSKQPAAIFGMNRLNHCPPIFREYYRSGDSSLRETALLWCQNFYDLTVWQGRTPDFGGARYNNASAQSDKAHADDRSYMWRTNYASHFCTKGFDSFFYAYEESGDPRMLTALEELVGYARSGIHANSHGGEVRNIGTVSDFLALYRFTGVEDFLEQALRLFREMRLCLTEDCLFSQSCDPIEADPPFIEEDAAGYRHPFVKPYIVGYALAGLPELAGLAPEEDRLNETVESVANFLAGAMDPVGGWRYPHPSSSSCFISQALEHAHQICNAIQCLEERGKDVEKLLDALERPLQARIQYLAKSGEILHSLDGWEKAAGIVKDTTSMYALYKKPSDRDPSRDYSEGAVTVGVSSPEGLVYFTENLAFYLKRRSYDRLLKPEKELGILLERAVSSEGR